jgi:hypothetical protein
LNPLILLNFTLFKKGTKQMKPRFFFILGMLFTICENLQSEMILSEDECLRLRTATLNAQQLLFPKPGEKIDVSKLPELVLQASSDTLLFHEVEISMNKISQTLQELVSHLESRMLQYLQIFNDSIENFSQEYNRLLSLVQSATNINLSLQGAINALNIAIQAMEAFQNSKGLMQEVETRFRALSDHGEIIRGFYLPHTLFQNMWDFLIDSEAQKMIEQIKSYMTQTKDLAEQIIGPQNAFSWENLIF